MSSIISHEASLAKSVKEEIASLLEFLEDSRTEGRRLDEVERSLWKKLQQLGSALLRKFIEAAGDGDAGKVLTQNGRTLRRSREKHPVWYRSTFGCHRIERFVYRVREKTRVEAAPLDEQLGLPAGEQSYLLEEWVSRLVAHMSYEAAVKLLGEMLGINTHVRTAETMVRKLSSYVKDFQEQRPMLEAPQSDEILVAATDGKGVPIRRPLEQRIHDELGRQPHKRTRITPYKKAEKRRSRGDKKVGKQMVSVAALYRLKLEPRTPQGFLNGTDSQNRPRPQQKRLFAEMTEIREDHVSRGAERLFSQLQREVTGCVKGRNRTLICLADGDRSLWKLIQQYFPDAIGILDIYHVMEKLWLVAYCFHPQGSASAEAFASHYLEMLLEGKVHCAIGVFRRWLRHRKLSPAKIKILKEVTDYFDRYRLMMRYDQYLKAGYPIGSGVAEGACRHVVADRLEQTGMRWEIEGAQSMLNLRTTYLNGELSDFFEYRIKTEQNTLYASAA